MGVPGDPDGAAAERDQAGGGRDRNPVDARQQERLQRPRHEPERPDEQDALAQGLARLVLQRHAHDEGWAHVHEPSRREHRGLRRHERRFALPRPDVAGRSGLAAGHVRREREAVRLADRRGQQPRERSARRPDRHVRTAVTPSAHDAPERLQAAPASALRRTFGLCLDESDRERPLQRSCGVSNTVYV